MIITEAEIKERIVRHYGADLEVDSSRRLNKAVSPGCVLYSLEGTPPKGYALYIPELRQISFYGVHGNRWRVLEGVEQVQPDQPPEPEEEIRGLDLVDWTPDYTKTLEEDKAMMAQRYKDVYGKWPSWMPEGPGCQGLGEDAEGRDSPED